MRVGFSIVMRNLRKVLARDPQVVRFAERSSRDHYCLRHPLLRHAISLPDLKGEPLRTPYDGLDLLVLFQRDSEVTRHTSVVGERLLASRVRAFRGER